MYERTSLTLTQKKRNAEKKKDKKRAIVIGKPGERQTRFVGGAFWAPAHDVKMLCESEWTSLRSTWQGKCTGELREAVWR
jgi:hypothetical protein